MREAEFEFKIHKRLQQGGVLIYNPYDMKLRLTIKVFYEGTSKDAPWVSYNPEFKVASCGPTPQKAESNLKEAIRGVLETCEDIGTLEDLMQDAGFLVEDKKINLAKSKTKIENLEVSIPALSL